MTSRGLQEFLCFFKKFLSRVIICDFITKKLIFFQHFAIFVGLWPPYLDEEDIQSIGQFFYNLHVL